MTGVLLHNNYHVIHLSQHREIHLETIFAKWILYVAYYFLISHNFDASSGSNLLKVGMLMGGITSMRDA